MNFSKKKKFLLIAFLFFLILFSLSFRHIFEKNEIEYGITFSKKQAEDLGLDWQKIFLNALDELKIKNWRLSAYWNEVEEKRGEYRWEDLDWQINEVQKNNGKIILAIGARLPRWPECHIPAWANSLKENEREEAQLLYLRKAIERYKNISSIYAWQIENEPFLIKFGECPPLNIAFLDKEISLAKSLDSRPIVVTDSGELSVWVPAAKRADIFGTTMYRDTYSSHLKRYIHYPIGPWFFRLKRNLTAFFAKPKEWIVIELQAEPWGPVPFQNMTKEERERTMDKEKFKDILEFSRKTGFKTFYLWGLEWWYWEKEKGNNPDILNEAKIIFQKDNLTQK